MEMIKSLTESKLFSSKASFKRYTGRQLAEFAYFHIIALRIMSCEKITIQPAKQYSIKTDTTHDFKDWKQNGTDLYLLMHSLVSSDIHPHDQTSEHFIKTLVLDIPKITLWLKSIHTHDSNSTNRAHRLFATLDNQFKVVDGSYRSIRRLAMNWDDITLRQKQLCFTRLVQIMRTKCHSSDLLPWLERLSRNTGLELQDACDAETEECGPTTTLSRAAQMYASIKEDDGGATTSADIAPLIKPLGKVRKRNEKD